MVKQTTRNNFLTRLLAVKQRNLKAKFENFNCNIIFNLCSFKLFNHVSFVKNRNPKSN